MIETIRQEPKGHGYEVSISKLCDWLDVPGRTFYYRSEMAAPKV